MKDWTVAFKEKMSAERVSPPAGELELIEGMIRRDRRRRHIRQFSVSVVAIAATIAMIIVFTTNIHREVEAPIEILTTRERIADNPVVFSDSQVQQLMEPKTEKIELKALRSDDLEEEIKAQEDEDQEIQNESEKEVKDNLHPDERVNVSEMDQRYVWLGEGKNESKSTRVSISLFSGHASSGSDGVVSLIQDYPIMSPGDEIDYRPGDWSEGTTDIGSTSYQHNHPRIFGISVGYDFFRGLTLVSGLDYALCTSKISELKRSSLNQKVHYLGIPLRLDWNLLQTNNFSLYIGAGGEAWRCLYAKRGETNLKDSRVYLSALGLAGLNYKPVRNVGIFIEPQYSHTFLPENPAVRTALTDNPDLFSLRLGLRFSFE